MEWVILGVTVFVIVFSIIIFKETVNSNKTSLQSSPIKSSSIALLAANTKLARDEFPLSANQHAALWREAVAGELSFLLLIIYIQMMRVDGMNDKKQQLVSDTIEQWSGAMASLLGLESTEASRTLVKQQLAKKAASYMPMIAQILHDSITTDVNGDCVAQYDIYRKFLEFMDDNLQVKVTSRPADGISGAMSYIASLQNYHEIMFLQIIDEQFASMTLRGGEILTDNDKIEAKQRAIFLADVIIGFAEACIQHRAQIGLI
ncbi:Uncharacterised protein [Moraxella caviae]|uniref:Uncharacterized protein n=1 Tax=Moraxella caviae TaxID=34060 RepID=A0A378R5I7_9GAMM|nr:hypothetical protein [Moraxella caviae]STZ10545.1 Uncharacterised protein [Moraxella caviae]VEW11346.1 Uncharacterised protein [Moraxella caviae]